MPRASTSLDIRPVTGVLGADIVGVDLSADLDEATVDAIRTAVNDHLVVFFPDQRLTPERQVAFSRRFGPYGPVPFVAPMPGHPEVIRVVKEADEAEAFNFGGAWHSDFSFQPEPPAYTILHAVDVPPYGGDTAFASMVAAFEALSEELKAELDDVMALHSARDAYSPRMQWLHSQLGHMEIVCDESAEETVLHPLVCTHPETGRRVLFFNSVYVRELVGPSPERATELKRFLDRFTTDIRFTCRHRWRNGSVAMWDNRATQHLALNDYGGRRRELWRTTVAGTAPAR